MNEFATWYIEFVQTIFDNIIAFFGVVFNAIAQLFYHQPIYYVQSFFQASTNFGLTDWIIGILVLLINLIFILALIILVYQSARRYIRFVSREISKDNMLFEISSLNEKIMDLNDEKNAILELKAGEFSSTRRGGSQAKKDENEEEKQTNKSTRFTKLIAVDETYHYTKLQTQMTDIDKITLEALVKRFIGYAASQLDLYYSEKIVSIFFAGMATSKTMILEGISGTGKTSLPYAMGKFFNNDADIISVQPSWRDRTEMIGYLNEFTKRFNETDFLKSIYESTYRTDLNFVILDEMNLARIEYYFADFLSIMEMPNPKEWLIDVVSDSLPDDPLHLKNGKLLLPQNVWFIGTANRDDSTFQITDKVYDRAASIELNVKADYIDAPFTDSIHMTYDYLESLFGEALKSHAISQKSLKNLEKLDQFITEHFQITFGNRIMKQIRLFVPVFVACGQSEIDGLDYIITRKILRKFEALNLPFLQKELGDLLIVIEKLFGKNAFPEARGFIQNLRKQI